MSTTFVAVPELETAPLAGGGSVLYSAKTGKFVMLNRSADQLWSEMSSGKTEDELVRSLRATYPGLETPAAREAVRQTIESLRGLDLLLMHPEGGGVDRASSAARSATATREARGEFATPSVNVLGEDDLLKVFQMTAAEISVAGCWWGNCQTNNP